MIFNITFSPMISALFHQDKKILNTISKLVGNRLGRIVYILLADFIVLWEEILMNVDLFSAKEILILLPDLGAVLHLGISKI